MPNSFACSCGAQLSVKPELAGKRIACPQCGQPVTVPTVPSGVTVRCKCGKVYQVKPQMAGKTVRCTACGGLFIVPGPGKTGETASVRAASDEADSGKGDSGSIAAAATPLSRAVPRSVSPSTAAKASRKARRVNRTMLVGIAIAGGAAVVVLLAMVAFLLFARGSAAPDQSTPEAVYQAFARAEAADQYLAVFDLVTPQSQEFLAGMAAFALHGSAPIDKRALRLLEKHSAKAAENAVLTPNNPNDPRQLLAAMRKLGERIPDKRAFYAEALQFFKSFDDESLWDRLGGSLMAGPKTALRNVVVDGDRARGASVMTFDGKTVEQPVVFLRIDGLWRVDLTESGPPP